MIGRGRYLGALAVLLVIAGISYAWIEFTDRRGQQDMMDINARFADYDGFRKAMMEDLPLLHDDLIVFDLPKKPFFQEISQNAVAYQPLMTRYLTDITVPFSYRLGAGAAMLELPDDRLIEVLQVLNRQATEQPDLARLLKTMLTNSYRSGLLADAKPFTDDALINRARQPNVRALLAEIVQNPAIPENMKGPDTAIGQALAE